jgi:DNA-binding CsgD family transcriptional regulator
MSRLGNDAGASGTDGSRSIVRDRGPRSLGSSTLNALAKWNAVVGDVLRNFNNENLLGTLIDALSYRTWFDSWLVAIFHADAQPTLIDYKESKDKEDQYATGPYLLDPYYNIFLSKQVSGCYLLRDIAPDHFTKSEFFRNYYSRIGLSDEIGYILWKDKLTAAHVSIARARGAPRFLRKDLAWFQAAQPIVDAVTQQLWQRSEKAILTTARQRSEFHSYLKNAFRNFGVSTLTPREQEITRLLLKGFSAKSIARILGISSGTVRNHMKQVYSKLEVNSQVELFSLFFETLDEVSKKEH